MLSVLLFVYVIALFQLTALVSSPVPQSGIRRIAFSFQTTVRRHCACTHTIAMDSRIASTVQIEMTRVLLRILSSECCDTISTTKLG